MFVSRRMLLGVTVLALLSVGTVDAADSASIQMTVGEMCGGCVKKITARLQKMPEVASVTCDAKTKSVTVVPKAGKSLGGQAVWDAMVEIDKTPAKLVNSAGTFTTRPAN